MLRPLRLLIIGIDGADHQRVAGYMADGTMPNLAELARRGAFCQLRSIIPPVTPAAWTTITTGRNPGKHGLYEFRRLLCGAGGYALADERRTPTLFHALNRHGLRVGLYNVPWTFPPDHYDGFVVGGMEALRLRRGMAWPPEAFDAFAAVVGDDYEPWPMIAPGGKLDAIKVRRYIDLRVSVSRDLLPRFPVDAYMVVFNMADFVQHVFMGRPAAQTVAGDRLDDPVRWVHALIDCAVGHLLADLAGPDTIVCIVSDHGMTAADRVVNMEKLFADRGWLAPAGGRGHDRLWAAALTAWRALRSLLPASVREAVRGAVRRQVAERAPMQAADDTVDWSRTVAAPFHAYGCIRINLAGRDPAGIVPPDRYDALVDEIADALLSLRFPTDGEPVFQAVARRDELFHGPALDLAPDLVAVPTRWRYWMPAGRGTMQTAHLLGQTQTLAPLDPPTGVHRLSGILLLAGPGVAPGATGRARLVDVAPTLLHLLGLPVPEDVDGRPLADVMADELRQRPVQREAEPELTDQGERTELGRDEQRQLEDRLRDLGYL